MADIAGLGALQKALLSAIDQVGAVISDSLQNNPGTVFVYQKPGLAVDPKRYLNPWLPEGDVYALMDSTGHTVPGAGSTPGKPGTPDPNLQASIAAAAATADLVDDHLALASPFAAKSLGSASTAWGVVQQAISGDPPTAPSKDVQDKINMARNLLYVNGRVGRPTQGYQDYQFAVDALAKARKAKSDAFYKAMADPALGQAWPMDSASYDNDIHRAETDMAAADHADSSMAYSEAADFLYSQGTSIIDAAVRGVKDRWSTYGELGTARGTFPLTILDPPSWCDVTDDSFGAMQLSVSNFSYESASANGFSDNSTSYYNDSGSSNGGGVGIVWGPFSATAGLDTTSADYYNSQSASQSSGGVNWDRSQSASITGEYFVVNVKRPWLFEEIFRINSGWYVKDQPKNYISDGTNSAANNGNWMPSLIVQLLVARNLTITCDDWGDVGTHFANAAQSSSSSSHTDSTSFAGSVGIFGLGGTYNHNDWNANGQYFQHDDGQQSWSYQQSGSGGTLVVHGTQIVGWLVRVVPASPPKASN
ncbi:hypothetical protein [Nocardia arthritidis]|uniref:Uncharacterized protein n=1 Tax=Nocardia arthritidis TaxID=228602 RepID=A0A6G9YMR5_9NOCA|nr:hypothetical protein [Nocardia arthritidis]QIS14367.1 hypothetical protein F5544_32650 [Nocardia arthritidis]